jgi:hypothetical protein
LVDLPTQTGELPTAAEPDTLLDTATESPAERASVAAELAAGAEAPELEPAAPEAPQEEPSVFEPLDATSGPSAQEETDYVASVQASVPPASDAPTLDMADPMVETALTLSEQVAQMRDNLRILAARLQDAAAVNPGVAALGAEVDLAFGAAGALRSSPAMGDVPSAAVPAQPGGEPPGVLEGEVEEAAAHDGDALEAAISAAGSGEAATQATAEPASLAGAPDAGEVATRGPATPPPAADPFAEAETAIRELQQALANRAGRGPNGPVETAPPTPESAPDPTGDRLSTQSSSTAPAPGATSLDEPVISPAEAEALRAMRALQSAQRREERRPWWRIW